MSSDVRLRRKQGPSVIAVTHHHSMGREKKRPGKGKEHGRADRLEKGGAGSSLEDRDGWQQVEGASGFHQVCSYVPQDERGDACGKFIRSGLRKTAGQIIRVGDRRQAAAERGSEGARRINRMERDKVGAVTGRGAESLEEEDKRQSRGSGSVSWHPGLRGGVERVTGTGAASPGRLPPLQLRRLCLETARLGQRIPA